MGQSTSNYRKLSTLPTQNFIGTRPTYTFLIGYWLRWSIQASLENLPLNHCKLWSRHIQALENNSLIVLLYMPKACRSAWYCWKQSNYSNTTKRQKMTAGRMPPLCRCDCAARLCALLVHQAVWSSPAHFQVLVLVASFRQKHLLYCLALLKRFWSGFTQWQEGMRQCVKEMRRVLSQNSE